MYTRRGVIVAAIISVPTLMMSGCGGGKKPDSQYRGAYRSAYTIPSLNETGTFSFSIAQKGEMTGSLLDQVTNKAYAFNGKIDNSGAFWGDIKDGATVYPLSGTFAPSGTGAGSGGGDFKQTRNGAEVRGSFSLTEGGIEQPTSSAYQGAYNGAFRLGNGNTGVASFSVDARGGIVGSLARPDETGVFSGSVRNDGRFDGVVNFPSGAVSLSGTLIKGANGAPGGNFTQTGGGQTVSGSFEAPAPLPAGNSFVGSYRGSFTVPSLGQSGPVSYTVNPTGNIVGSFTRTAGSTQSGEVGIFTGVVSADGTLTGTVAYPSGTVAINGTLIANTNGEPRGDFTQTTNGVISPGSFSGAVETPGENGFQGAYRGTYAVPERGESGNVSFTINPTGDLIGFISQSNNTPVGTIRGRVENNGAFDCTISYLTELPDPYATARPFKGRIARTTVGGTGGLAGDFVMTITTNTAQGTKVEAAGNFELSIGGSEPNSDFRGSYGGGIAEIRQETTVPGENGAPPTTTVNILPAIPGISFERVNPPGIVLSSIFTNFTVDQQGDFIGTWGGVNIRGRISNDGRLTGTYGPHQIVGKVAKQEVPQKYDQSGEVVYSGGMAGNFVITVNGQEYIGSFFGTGGTE
jgi:hypothetical protein